MTNYRRERIAKRAAKLLEVRTAPENFPRPAETIASGLVDVTHGGRLTV